MTKKNKKVNKEEVETIRKVIGTPTMMLLPARNYTFKVIQGEYNIRVPRKGKYTDFDDKLYTEADGEFDFLQHHDEANAEILYVPVISKALFAIGKYPNLQDGQAFTPIALVIKEDEVEIIGHVIEMVKEKE